LVNTGKPKVSTGECVEAVTVYLQNSSLMDDFSQVALAMDKALEQNDIFEFANCIKENHQLLKHIGVVPKKVVNFIEEIEARGGAAKVSGAGAITDDRAGVVLIASEKDISDIVEEYGYEIIPVEGESDGVKII
jgi:mevalonate kinase